MSSQEPTAFEDLLARRGLLAMLVAAVTFVAYSGTLGFDFLYDDFPVIVRNPAIRVWSYLPRYFSEHVWAAIYPGVAGSYYRPLFLLWLRVNYVFFHLHPAGWHLASVLCHVGVTLLVYRLLLGLLRQREAAFVTALLFGLHPVHIEAVAWISAVSELLLTACVLGALLALMRAQGSQPRWRWLLAAAALYAAAMLFKETGIVLIVLAAAFCLLLSANDSPGRWARVGDGALAVLALLPVTAAYLVARWQVLHGMGREQSSASWPQMAITWPAALLSYAKHLVFPVHLNYSYDFGYVPRATLEEFWWPCLVLLGGAATILLVARGRERRLAGFALVLLLAPLTPVLYLRALAEDDLIHDRYLYLPSVGWALLLALLYQRLRQAKSGGNLAPRLARAGAGVFAALFLAALVTQQVHWANNLVFYSHNVESAPRNLVMLNNLGNEFLERGDAERATVLFQRVLARDPQYWFANFNLGYLLYRQGRYLDAEHYLRTALGVQPTDADSCAYLGMTELQLNHLEAAQTHLERALVLRPDGYGFHAALALVLAARGDAAGSRRQYQAELALYPANLNARKALEALDKP